MQDHSFRSRLGEYQRGFQAPLIEFSSIENLIRGKRMRTIALLKGTYKLYPGYADIDELPDGSGTYYRMLGQPTLVDLQDRESVEFEVSSGYPYSQNFLTLEYVVRGTRANNCHISPLQFQYLTDVVFGVGSLEDEGMLFSPIRD